jgi:PIN domain nuclease of toxin-antitoxin system
MNLFLDTHVLLWWLDDNPNLSGAEKIAIADPGNLIIVSAAVISFFAERYV